MPCFIRAAVKHALPYRVKAWHPPTDQLQCVLFPSPPGRGVRVSVGDHAIGRSAVADSPCRRSAVAGRGEGSSGPGNSQSQSPPTSRRVPRTASPSRRAGMCVSEGMGKTPTTPLCCAVGGTPQRVPHPTRSPLRRRRRFRQHRAGQPRACHGDFVAIPQLDRPRGAVSLYATWHRANAAPCLTERPVPGPVFAVNVLRSVLWLRQSSRAYNPATSASAACEHKWSVSSNETVD